MSETIIKQENEQLFPECYWCADNVGRVALWGNIGLFAIKLMCGVAGNSKALLADAVHSGADVLTAAVVMICLHISKSPPDDEHPYGHGNTEYIASMFIGISLFAVVVLIIYSSLIDIINGVSQHPDTIALAGLLISIAGNELMFRHSYCCGIRFRSPAMIANAWENRADVYSSIAALVGVVGALIGMPLMDSIGAILVALLIARTAYEMVKDAWNGILDHAIDENIEANVRNTAMADQDVKDIVYLRTRTMGPYYSIDLKLAVSPDMSLSHSYHICDRVKQAIANIIDMDTTLGFLDVSPAGYYAVEGVLTKDNNRLFDNSQENFS
ncbi:MAG: mamM [Candidatus Magnetoglobus multicellularis str. Araruama]|uniref:MamM n=2 Tax=Candidatus Magnetoglobus multicellularis TaxID=418099 RepID=F4ZYU7_9BACT|nr:MamM [Candidatus Magnetoglobus multicellularis]ETR64743.1 MAG: mamM [Candidatus Magnetoglobus multicellularis str. Araruama]